MGVITRTLEALILPVLMGSCLIIWGEIFSIWRYPDASWSWPIFVIGLLLFLVTFFSAWAFAPRKWWGAPQGNAGRQER